MWWEYRYISDNGEDAILCGYSRSSHDKNRKIKGGVWRDKHDVVHKVKLKPVKKVKNK